jgi:hypothetical protein
MLWPNWPSSDVQVLEETAALLSCCYSVGFPAFKKDSKSFLLKQSFYTINEFVSFNKNVDGASTYVWMS